MKISAQVDRCGSPPIFVLAPTGDDLFTMEVVTDPTCRINLRGCIDLNERKAKCRLVIAEHFDIFYGSFGYKPLSDMPLLVHLLSGDDA